MSHLPRFCPSDADFALDTYRQVVNCALVRESRRKWVALTAPHILNISSIIPASEQIYRPSLHLQEPSTHTDDHPHKLSPPPFPTITLTDLNPNNALAGPPNALTATPRYKPFFQRRVTKLPQSTQKQTATPKNHLHICRRGRITIEEH